MLPHPSVINDSSMLNYDQQNMGDFWFVCETAQVQVLQPLPVGVEQINLSVSQHSVASERGTQTGGW